MKCTPRARSRSTFSQRRRVQPHLAVHRGRDEDRRARRQRDGRQRVVGKTLREFRDDLRRGRCDEQQIRAVGQFDVARLPAFLFVEEIRHHRMLRQAPAASAA